jgi:hypothetical protein
VAEWVLQELGLKVADAVSVLGDDFLDGGFVREDVVHGVIE